MVSLKVISLVVCRVAEPVKVVTGPKFMEFAERIPALELRLIPEELPRRRSPSIEPLATKATVPEMTPFPPIVRSAK